MLESAVFIVVHRYRFVERHSVRLPGWLPAEILFYLLLSSEVRNGLRRTILQMGFGIFAEDVNAKMKICDDVILFNMMFLNVLLENVTEEYQPNLKMLDSHGYISSL